MTDGLRVTWQNAIANLYDVVGDFASPSTTERLSSGVEDDVFNTKELWETFTDFYRIVGPGNNDRYRALSPALDDMLRHFASTLKTVVGLNWRGTRDSVLVASDEWQALQAEAALLVAELKPLLRSDRIPTQGLMRDVFAPCE